MHRVLMRDKTCQLSKNCCLNRKMSELLLLLLKNFVTVFWTSPDACVRAFVSVWIEISRGSVQMWSLRGSVTFNRSLQLYTVIRLRLYRRLRRRIGVGVAFFAVLRSVPYARRNFRRNRILTVGRAPLRPRAMAPAAVGSRCSQGAAGRPISRQVQYA